MKYLLIMLSLLFLVGCNNQNINSNTTNTNSLNTTRVSFENTLSNLAESTEYIPKEETISTYSSKILNKEENRQNNVEITCSKLNNLIIKSGETFSFCDTLGPSSTKDGFKKADMFDSKGNKISGLGGGKCQVSSTLYNAVLAVPELTIIERHEHSRDVDYVPEGLDAAVAYGSIDLKFKNDTQYSVKINATATKEDVTISLIKIP